MVPPIPFPYVLDSKMLSPKSDIQARGGVSLLIKILGCDNKLMESILIVAPEEGKTIEISTHPFYISVNDSKFMEILQAFCNVL